MKHKKLLISMATAALFALSCADADFIDPEASAKTGTGGSGVTDINFANASQASSIVAAAAASAISGVATPVKWEYVETGVRPNTFATSGTTQAAQTQVAFLSNGNFNNTNDGKNTLQTVKVTLTWTWGSVGSAAQKVGVLQAFSADLNDDGTNDSLAYGVQLSKNNGAGGILFIRNSTMSGVDAAADGTCVSANLFNGLATDGEHTAVITITPALSTGLPATISVEIDGGTAVTSTDVIGGAMSACAGAGADAGNTGLTAGGSGATLGALLFGGKIPVYSIQLQGFSADSSIPVDANDAPIVNRIRVEGSVAAAP